ncbi:MAG TPA: hypothetical protein VHG30_04665 [Microvirga sp.]|nr:hypothetical protein [Microvirga sp.]
MTEPPRDRRSSGRRVAVRILAALALVSFAFFFSLVTAEALGVVDARPQGSPTDPPPSPEARAGAMRPAEVVHVVGALAILAIGASGLIALIARPEDAGHSYQVLGAMGGLTLTLPIVGNPNNVGGQAGVIDPVPLAFVVPAVAAALLARPWRYRPKEWRPRFFVLAAVGSIPAAWYGVEQALIQRNTFPPTADPHHNAHWWAMAVFAFVVVFVIAAAALPGAQWRLGPRLAALAAVAFGIASLVARSSASAVWAGWAIAAVVWGLVAIWFTFHDVRGTVAQDRSRASP